MTRTALLLAVALAYFVAVAVVAYLYPELSGAYAARWQLGPVYLGAHLAAVAVVAVAWLSWLRRRERPRREHLAVLILGTAEFLVVGSGPGPFGIWARWDLAQWIYLVAFGALAAVCWRAGGRGLHARDELLDERPPRP